MTPKNEARIKELESYNKNCGYDECDSCRNNSREIGTIKEADANAIEWVKEQITRIYRNENNEYSENEKWGAIFHMLDAHNGAVVLQHKTESSEVVGNAAPAHTSTKGLNNNAHNLERIGGEVTKDIGLGNTEKLASSNGKQKYCFRQDEPPTESSPSDDEILEAIARGHKQHRYETWQVIEAIQRARRGWIPNDGTYVKKEDVLNYIEEDYQIEGEDERQHKNRMKREIEALAGSEDKHGTM